MQLDIRADTTAVKQLLKDLGKQGPFAAALGTTRTVQDAQRAVQARMPRAFTLRGTEALFRKAVKITTATKSRPEGNVRIEGPETPKGPDARVSRIILRHEEGGVKDSAAMYRVSATGQMRPLGFFLPASGLRTANASVPKKYYPRNIGAATRKNVEGTSFFADSRKGKKVQRGQAQREFSYFVTPKGIYERRVFGSGSAVRPLWFFNTQIRLTPRLQFFETVERVSDERFVPNIRAAIDEAIRTARP